MDISWYFWPLMLRPCQLRMSQKNLADLAAEKSGELSHLLRKSYLQWSTAQGPINIGDSNRWKHITLVICYIAIENDHRNRGFSQLQHGGSFHSYVTVYQRVKLQAQCCRPPTLGGLVLPISVELGDSSLLALPFYHSEAIINDYQPASTSLNIHQNPYE